MSIPDDINMMRSSGEPESIDTARQDEFDSRVKRFDKEGVPKNSRLKRSKAVIFQPRPEPVEHSHDVPRQKGFGCLGR